MIPVLVSAIIVALLAQGLGVLLLTAAVDFRQFDAVSLLLPLLAFLLIAGSVLLGGAVGSAFSIWLAPPAIALCIFTYLFVGSFLDEDRWSAIAPIYPATFYQIFLVPNGIRMGLQVAVMSVLVCLLALRPGSARWSMLALTTIFALSIGVLIGYGGDMSPVEQRRAPMAPPCGVTAGVSFCAWPAHADQIGPMLQALATLHARGQERISMASSFYEMGLSSPRGSTQIQLPAKRVTDNSYFAAAASALVPIRCGSDASLNAADNLREWLLAGTSGQQFTTDEVQQISAASGAAEMSWLSSQVKLLDSCP